MKKELITILLICYMSFITVAQDTPLCPAEILLGLARAGSTCYGLAEGRVCFGNGSVSAIDFYGEERFIRVGDQTPVASIEKVRTQIDTETIGVALMNIPSDWTGLSGRSVTVALIGDVTLTNRVLELPTVIVNTRGIANVRRVPEPDGEILLRVPVNDSLIANGRLATNDWLRVHIPNTNDFGWVASDFVTLSSLNELNIVEIESPIQRPFEYFDVQSGIDSLCEGALPSGLLIQTANTSDAIRFVINDVAISIAGTVFIQADSLYRIHTLQGLSVVEVDERLVVIPEGARLFYATDEMRSMIVEPYEVDSLAGLPLALLPKSLRLASPATPESIAEAQTNYHRAAEAIAEPTPLSDESLCQRVVVRDAMLYAGAGDFYEAINPISAGTSINPIRQTTDPNGNVWWQLQNSNWILASLVQQTGDCDEVPPADIIPPPATNTLSLETCETTNGPLRVGQLVTIEFIPPPFANLGEAQQARIIDPGYITVGSRRYRATADSPIRLDTVGDEDRYIRRFYIEWIAVAGTHRIVGSRLTYSPICTITVPIR